MRSRILLLAAILLPILTLHAIVDTNDNGLSDLWEKQHNEDELFSGTFDPDADPDADGWNNAQEAAAGTDPSDTAHPGGYLQPETVHLPEAWVDTDNDNIPDALVSESIQVSWPTIPGKQYTFQSNATLAPDNWINVGSPFIGAGTVVTYGFFTSAAAKTFWRVGVTDVDSDEDDLTDWEENELGTNPLHRDSDGDGLSDGWEITNGLDANDDGDGDPNQGGGADVDGDGLTNLQEQGLQSHPWKTDTDMDGASDSEEARSGHNPKSKESHPPIWIHTRRHSYHLLPYIQSTMDWNLNEVIVHENTDPSESAKGDSAALLAASCPFPAQPLAPGYSPFIGYTVGLNTSVGTRPHPGPYTHLVQTRFWSKTLPAPSSDIKTKLLKVTRRKVTGTSNSEVVHPPVMEVIEVTIPSGSTTSNPVDILPDFTEDIGDQETESVEVDLFPVDLEIFNGQAAANPVAEDKEETVGAFTVANLNNTDADGEIDNTDDSVKKAANAQDGVEDEVDLMKLIVTGPKNGRTKITVISGAVEFWEKSTKETKKEKVGNAIFIVGTDLPKTLWVEATNHSNEVRDIELRLGWESPDQTLTDNLDTVKATAIWATNTEVRNTTEQTLWNEVDDVGILGNWNNNYGGDHFGIHFEDAPVGIAYNIGFQFTLLPTGIGAESIVKFDVTRQAEVRIWGLNLILPSVVPPPDPVPQLTYGNESFPFGDKANDNVDATADQPVADRDNDNTPTNDHIYSIDAPGRGTRIANEEEYIFRANFREFVRVKFDGQKPTGNILSGSRCSPKKDWHLRIHAINDNGTHKQNTNKPNDVDIEHIEVGEEP